MATLNVAHLDYRVRPFGLRDLSLKLKEDSIWFTEAMTQVSRRVNESGVFGKLLILVLDFQQPVSGAVNTDCHTLYTY